MFFYYLVQSDDEPITRFANSPCGSKCALRIIPLFYSKIINKPTRQKIVKELWRQAIKKLGHEIAGSWSWRIGIEQLRMLSKLVRCVYRYFYANGRVPEGIYVFSDLERLSDEGLTKAEQVRTVLAQSSSAVRILNSPARTMRRYDVLNTMYEQGINDFRAYRLRDEKLPHRYPVFLRRENAHRVASTLIPNREIFDYVIRFLEDTGQFTEDLLVTEFCDTADEKGLYRKYSALVVGDWIFPRNISFSTRWMVKRKSELKAEALLRNRELLVEEQEFIRTNPHGDILRKVFSLAGIEYGRIDYSVWGDSIRVWEINTNPHITYDGEDRVGPRKPIFDFVEQTMVSALMSASPNNEVGRDLPQGTCPSRPDSAQGAVKLPL
jgi:hypothetical protein